MSNSKFTWLFNLSATIEITIGIVLLLVPVTLINLLLGEVLGETGIMVARVAGLGLFSLGIASVEVANLPVRMTTRIGLLIYNAGASFYLAYLAATGAANGVLIWPTIVLHLIIASLMIWVLGTSRN